MNVKLALVPIYCVTLAAGSASARHIVLSYGDSLASRTRDLDRLPVVPRSYVVVLLPWTLCHRLIGDLDRQVADLAEGRKAIAKALSEFDPDPRGQVPDTIMVIHYTDTEPISALLCEYDYSGDASGNLTARVKELPLNKQEELASLSLARLRVRPRKIDGSTSLHFYTEFIADDTVVTCQGKYRLWIDEYAGIAPPKTVRGNVVVREFMKHDAFVEDGKMVVLSTWCRYSPVYGPTAMLAEQRGVSGGDMAIWKLTWAYDSAVEVPIAELSSVNDNALPRKSGSCKWVVILASLISTAIGLLAGLLFGKRPRPK